MFQMNPGALDSEAQRRRELAFATMRAAHRTPTDRRISGIQRIRHVVVALAAIAAAQLA